MHEGGEALGAVDAPVELGGEVIDPAVGEPFAGIAGEVLVGIDTGGDAGGDSRFPDTKGADAHAYPWFGGFDRRVESLYEGINGRSAPGRTQAVGYIVVGGVGVEIVVKVYTVDVIAAHDIHDNLEDVLLGGRG